MHGRKRKSPVMLKGLTRNLRCSTLAISTDAALLYVSSPLRCVPSLLATDPACAQNRPRLHDIDGFMTKGVFTELDPTIMTHRLSLEEIEKAHLGGQPVDIQDDPGLDGEVRKAGVLRSKSLSRCEARFRLSCHQTLWGTRPTQSATTLLSSTVWVFPDQGTSSCLCGPKNTLGYRVPIELGIADWILPIRLFRLGYLKPDPIIEAIPGENRNRGGRGDPREEIECADCDGL